VKTFCEKIHLPKGGLQEEEGILTQDATTKNIGCVSARLKRLALLFLRFPIENFRIFQNEMMIVGGFDSALRILAAIRDFSLSLSFWRKRQINGSKE